MNSMDTTVIAEFLKDRLTTAAQMRDAAEEIGVSLATMYRFKKAPDDIPTGKLAKLVDYLHLPLENGAAWPRSDLVGAEQRRLALEEETARNKGRRLIVSPLFTVSAELPEVTKQLYQLDYQAEAPMAFLDARAGRAAIYESGQYESYELFSGFAYCLFFHGVGQFGSIDPKLRKDQAKRLAESLDYPLVRRRIYYRLDPELAMISCYLPAAAVIRVGDLLFEYRNSGTIADLHDEFFGLFDKARIQEKEEVRAFLLNPPRPPFRLES